MSGGDSHVDDSQLKGLSKYFNGQTAKGRANVSMPNFIFRLKLTFAFAF